MKRCENSSQHYVNAVNSKSICTNSIAVLESDNSPIAAGYRGALTIVLAKHTDNVFKKWNYFQQGKILLEESVRRSPNNVELRFLRLSIQYNIPAILAYRSEIADDKKYIISHLSEISDPNLKSIIVNFLIQIGSLPGSQKDIAQKL